uniref:Uncharacterized protein n=1 Tax=Acrobeloides nanus TaxID=290746 RepID=A0A914BWN2_9BILA
MAKFGLDYESLEKINKRIIYCSVTGYGSTGPYANDPGYDVIAEAVGGFMGTTGPVSGEPCKAAVAVTDLMTGLYAHGAILAALIYRSKTGKGQKIDCNLLATQISALVNLGSNYLNAGVEAKPWGTEHESIVPYQAFKTKDGRYYVIGCANNASFSELCKLMNLERLDILPEFKTNQDRVKNRKRLLKILQDKFIEYDLEHWNTVLRTSSFPSGPVNTMKEAFDHPQVKHLGLVQDVAHEKATS